jgi:hypothetical protein
VLVVVTDGTAVSVAVITGAGDVIEPVWILHARMARAIARIGRVSFRFIIFSSSID